MIKFAVLGLGEAGSRFANDLAAAGVAVTGWDPAPKRALDPRVVFAASNLAAAADADIILSANLSSVSEAIALEVAPVLNAQKIYLEMNTSGPEMKQAIAARLKSTGVAFVDLAIMAPVPPLGIKTPFLASGPGAQTLAEKVAHLNWDLTVIGDEIGEASTRKLLRSIVYKGVAAVIVEAVTAAKAFGKEDYIRPQISSVIGGDETLIDRFLEGTFIHAERRMHEMEAVTKMLKNVGIDPLMSKATMESLAKIIATR
jgi:3-hydroxyisobutyrate dehydrogenase-like beta-hydroxyacid dehydrogenase